MTAPRWILFALLAFGLGTGVAYAMNPPEPGVPVSTASKLAGDLSAIEQYASEGRCIAVRARLDGAQSRITKLPASTDPAVVDELQRALRRISTAARAECQAAFEAKQPEEQPTTPEETTPTTPQETTPAPPTDPQTTPDPGGNEGGPDPGTGEDPSGGITTPDEGTDPSGGVAPDIEGVTERLQKEKEKWEKRLRDAQDRWSQLEGVWAQ